MGKHVRGIRGEFFEYLEERYTEENCSSLVYRFTWKESAVELLKKLKKRAYFPDISTKALQEGREEKDFRDRLETAMKGCTGERFQSELEQELKELWQELLNLQEERQERQKERKLPKELQKERQRERRKKRQKEHPEKRRDLWQQLWINDTAFRAGKIIEKDYYLWLVEYLAARKKFYLDRCPSEKDKKVLLEELSRLAAIGLRGKEWLPELKRSEEEKGEGNIRKALLGDYLEQLAREMHDEEAGKTQIVDRLREADCLSRLWGPLERTAMHMKIKNWFQDSGYPLQMGEDLLQNKKKKRTQEKQKEQAKQEGKKEQKGDRKQDFTMRLFEDYYDSERRYKLGNWSLDDYGICVMEDKQANTLKNALESASKEMYLDNVYIPLGVHLYSGCVLFVAGKGVYKKLYSDPKEYKDATKEYSFCFDYLRLTEENFYTVAGGFRILPVFHKNAGKSFKDVLDEFKWYCVEGELSPLESVRVVNGDFPAGAPDAFSWAFCRPEQDDYEPTPEAVAEFKKDTENQKNEQKRISGGQ